jgi:hypothetical protein
MESQNPQGLQAPRYPEHTGASDVFSKKNKYIACDI